VPTYVGNGAWGTGTGAPLTQPQFDGNTYEFDTRITDLETNPPVANSIASMSVDGLSFSQTLTGGEVLGPFPITIPMFRWRGDWMPATLYAVLDRFVVAGTGEFAVLSDHTSAATFDAAAVGPAVTAGSFSIGTLYVIATVGTTDFTAIGAASNTVGVEFTATGVGAGTGTATAKRYRQLSGASTNTLLGDLQDVEVTGAVANNLLVRVEIGSPPIGSWEHRSPTQVTALLDVVVGDTGSPGGGIKGLVPAPADGDAAANKFLHAGGSFEIVTSGINQLTGDVTAGPGTGSQAATLATVNASPGTYSLATVTVNAKGLATAVSAGAGSAISDLPLATLPVAALSLLEISETDGGSPAVYTSKHIRISDLKLTLGSTEIALGSTTTTIAGLTLSGATLSGTTTLTGMTAGSILFAGAASALSQDNANLFWDDTNNRLGIGGVPAAQLHLQGNTSLAAATNGIVIRTAAATHTDTASSGSVTTIAANSLLAPTFAASNPVTYLQPATLLIQPPIAGSNVTLTNRHALRVLGNSGGEAGTAAPFSIMLWDNGTGGAWDIVNPFAGYDFGSNDGSGVGVGTRVRLGAVMEAAGGGTTRFGIFTSPVTAGTLVEQLSVLSGGDVRIVTGDLVIVAAGKGLELQSGSGARAGDATLVTGTVTVTNTTVTANTKVLLTRKTIGGTAGNLSYTLSAGASFTINSSSGTDTSTISYMLVEVN